MSRVFNLDSVRLLEKIIVEVFQRLLLVTHGDTP